MSEKPTSAAMLLLAQIQSVKDGWTLAEREEARAVALAWRPDDGDDLANMKRLFFVDGWLMHCARVRVVSDAANGVIGGREHPFAALCDLLPADVSWGDSLTPDIARHIVIAARAALTAEKVAAEPISDDHAATLWRLARMTDAAAWTAELRKAVAPQQPTQSAEQDEAAAYLVRGLDGYNEEYASVWIKRANADAAAAAIFRASITPLVVPSAASTQSTATQPAQTEVAAFEAWASENGLNPKIYTSKLNPGGAYGWAMKAWQARALLAAQPVSGADK